MKVWRECRCEGVCFCAFLSVQPALHQKPKKTPQKPIQQHQQHQHVRLYPSPCLLLHILPVLTPPMHRLHLSWFLRPFFLFLRPTSHSHDLLEIDDSDEEAEFDSQESSVPIQASFSNSTNSSAIPAADEAVAKEDKGSVGEIKGWFSTVWDGGKAVKYYDEDGAPMRKCLHGCGKSWKGLNHTKMLYHYLGGYQDVA